MAKQTGESSLNTQTIFFFHENNPIIGFTKFQLQIN